MLNFELPKEYINEPGILTSAGNIIKKYGNKAFIIGSKTSLNVAEKKLVDSLNKVGIEYEIAMFQGYPTMEIIQSLATGAKNFQAEVIIGLGGGKVMDVAKAVGSFSSASIVTIPTIAATCAAWAAFSIIYNEVGEQVDAYFNNPGPQSVIVDTEIIIEAPVRYLNAGIIDTFAKWFEAEPNYLANKNDTSFQVTADISKRAFICLEENAPQALIDRENHVISEATIQTVDAIIYLAGLAGSMQTGTLLSGVGHPFYNVTTFFEETHHRLHGEKVGFGLLLQPILRNDMESTKKAVELFGKFDNLFTLEDLGLINDSERVRELAEQTWNDNEELFLELNYGTTSKDIEEAFYILDSLVREKRVSK